MPICPRCRKDVDRKLYQPPVSICMVCYATTEGNEGLTLLQLKEKAIKSYRANRRKNLEKRRNLLESFSPYKHLTPTAHTDRRSSKGKNVDLEDIKQEADQHEVEWFNCAMCGDDVSDDDFGTAAFKMKDEHGKEIIKCLRCVSKYTPIRD